MLYRSSVLSKVGKKGKQQLNNLQIKTIIDLRSEDEYLHTPDVIVPMVSQNQISLLSSEDNPYLPKRDRLKVLKSFIKNDGGSENHLCNIYKKLISSELSIKGYKEIFQMLLNDDGAKVYHCTQGKDRTGMTTAVILMALGFDKEVIIQDYLSYNKRYAFRDKVIFVAVMTLLFSRKLAENLMYCIEAFPSLINSAFDELEEKYQTIDNYLHEAIGLTDEQIHLLREKYLVKEN